MRLLSLLLSPVCFPSELLHLCVGTIQQATVLAAYAIALAIQEAEAVPFRFPDPDSFRE